MNVLQRHHIVTRAKTDSNCVLRGELFSKRMHRLRGVLGGQDTVGGIDSPDQHNGNARHPEETVDY